MLEDEIMKLFYINSFFDLIIKKSGFNVHLFQVLIFDNDQYEDRFIWHKLDHKDEGFIIIQFFALFEISHHLTSFIMNNLIINVMLKGVNPFITKCNASFK